ncbi:hypothetical protein DdX_15800 [Ditylenchus destructor]|uniref:Uncharacterized protein n=1 Tax=Ditylenchus destructor TaxID=166010 RepID=A0AAD4MRI6_9BILA|nr:hypothetical protein DdX_15800 [Ditylenchus destructor]
MPHHPSNETTNWPFPGLPSERGNRRSVSRFPSLIQQTPRMINNLWDNLWCSTNFLIRSVVIELTSVPNVVHSFFKRVY